jgi:dTDP-4-dehydrorhamnose 3,5-epimerase
MIFTELELAGAFTIEPERYEDERGFFARTFDRAELAQRGLAADYPQRSIAWNEAAGTVRGLHFQFPPHAEVKLVQCTRGAVLDAIVDLRPESATYGRSTTVTLDDEGRRILYVPERFAHGYQVLRDATEVSYAMSALYEPSAQSGIRFDDPALGIEWPLPVTRVSDRDRALPLLAGSEVEARMAVAP